MADDTLRNHPGIADEAECRALLDTYFRYVYSIVYHILRDCGSGEDVEECIMNVFEEVIQHYNASHTGSLKAFVGTIAKRSALNMRRSLLARSSHMHHTDDETLEAIPSSQQVEETIECRQRNRILLDAVIALGEPDATIILQKFFYDRSAGAISQATGLSPAAVRMRSSRALKRLRKELLKKGIRI